MLPSRMRSVSHDSPSPPVRLLAWVGLAGLAALTLVDRGATRMYATPWTWMLVATLAAPVVALLLRALLAPAGLQLPALSWRVLAAAAGGVPLASALLSPYRAPSLLMAATPLAAVALFLLVHDWLAANPEARRAQLARILAAGAALVTLVSTAGWLVDVTPGVADGNFSERLAILRNPHPLGHPNYTAGLMLLGLPWLVVAAKANHGWRRIALGALVALALLNLFTSGSRGGILGLGALVLAGVAALRLGWKKFLLIAAGGVMLAAILALANPRIRATLRPPDPASAPNLSDVQRVAMFDAGWSMGRDRPLLGWGPGTTSLAYPRYRHTLEGGAENVLQLHSTAVQLWAETGAAGLLAGAVLGLMVVFSWRRSPVAAVTLAGYAVFSLTDYQLDVPIFAAVGAALLALLAKPSEAAARKSAGRTAALAVLGGATLIMALGQRDPAPALNVRALALARDPAQHDRAVALLRESLALNPDQEIAHFNLGWLLVVPDPAAAEKHFLAAAHLVPDKGGVYFGLGLARLNQGKPDAAARAFALECVNEPLFLASPWWTVPDIAALRERTRTHYESMLFVAAGPGSSASVVTWAEQKATQLRQLASQLGTVSNGPEHAYRRERIGYPVLMRNLDLPVPADLYDVREDPRFPGSVPFPLPSKGWLPSPRLLNLLDALAS